MNDTVMFEHDLVYREDLKRLKTPLGRFYLVDPRDGIAYPSVTTVLDKYFDKTYLDRWRKRVGEKEALLVTKTAAAKGTALHNMAEKFLMNEDYTLGDVMSLQIATFKPVAKLLEENVTLVHGTELPLFSHELQTAGTTDLLCDWNGEAAIVDFKTSRRHKTEKDIESYFVQAATYAYMAEVTYDLTIRKICIIMVVEHEVAPLVFEADPYEYYEQVKEIFCHD